VGARVRGLTPPIFFFKREVAVEFVSARKQTEGEKARDALIAAGVGEEIAAAVVTDCGDSLFAAVERLTTFGIFYICFLSITPTFRPRCLRAGKLWGGVQFVFVDFNFPFLFRGFKGARGWKRSDGGGTCGAGGGKIG
jgi:hypothetical protein